MEKEQHSSGPQPTGPFDHPGAQPLKEQSSDDAAGYDDQDNAAPETAMDPGVRYEALPPRGGAAVSREPLATRSRKK